MDELKQKYDRQLKEYDDLVASMDSSQVPKIRSLNTAISKTLNEMIEKLTFLKKETPNLKRERDILIVKLQRIQKDYNGLITDTDQLETLRRIRQQESSEGNRQLYWYLIAFLVASFSLVVYVIFYGKREATAATASAVPTTPALI